MQSGSSIIMIFRLVSTFDDEKLSWIVRAFSAFVSSWPPKRNNSRNAKMLLLLHLGLRTPLFCTTTNSKSSIKSSRDTNPLEENYAIEKSSTLIFSLKSYKSENETRFQLL